MHTVAKLEERVQRNRNKGSEPAAQELRPRFWWVFWVLKGMLLCTALISLLPVGNRLWAPGYFLGFGLPLAVFAVMRTGTRDFLLWSVYTLSFVLFAKLRVAAYSPDTVVFFDYPIVADRILALGAVPTPWLQERLYQFGQAAWWDTAAIAVHLTYYVVPVIGGLVIRFVRPSNFARFMIAISVMYLLGVIIHFIAPTAPPWMASAEGHLPPIHRILADILYRANPELYGYGYSIAGGNPAAAMPSMHMAATVAVAFGLSTLNRWGAVVGWLYVGAMCLALVYLGEHYITDGIAGGALAYGCWVGSGKALAAFDVRSRLRHPAH